MTILISVFSVNPCPPCLPLKSPPITLPINFTLSPEISTPPLLSSVRDVLQQLSMSMSHSFPIDRQIKKSNSNNPLLPLMCQVNLFNPSPVPLLWPGPLISL